MKNLATRLGITTNLANKTFADELGAITREKHAAREDAERAQIEEEKKCSVIIAQEIISTLPEFLAHLAKNGRHSAYIINQDICRPFDWQWPGRIPWRDHDTLQSVSVYKARRYLRGTMRKVALWGLAEGLSVGVRVLDSREVEGCINQIHPFNKNDGYARDGSYLMFRW